MSRKKQHNPPPQSNIPSNRRQHRELEQRNFKVDGLQDPGFVVDWAMKMKWLIFF